MAGEAQHTVCGTSRSTTPPPPSGHMKMAARIIRWAWPIGSLVFLGLAYAAGLSQGTRRPLAGDISATAAPSASPRTQQPKRKDEALGAASGRRASMLLKILESEMKDPEWALSAQERVASAIRALDAQRFPTTRLIKADCRKTLCLIRATVSSSEEAVRLPPALTRSGLRTFGKADTDATTGEVTWSMFMERPGHPLPQLRE